MELDRWWNRRTNSPISAPQSVYIITTGMSHTTGVHRKQGIRLPNEHVSVHKNISFPIAASPFRPNRNSGTHEGTAKAVGVGRQCETSSVRSHIIQAALWLPTMGEKEACLEGLMEQQDWDSSTESSTSSKTQRQTEGLQRLQSCIDLIVQDMNAVNRSCSSETAADFQPIDETLDIGGPPLVVPFFISPTPKYRTHTKPESPRDFSASRLPAATQLKSRPRTTVPFPSQNTRHQRESRHYTRTRL